MENTFQIFRLVESKWLPFLSGIVFLGLFYLGYFLLERPPLMISSFTVSDFASKYGVFVPLIYALIGILFMYILYLFAWIIRLRFWSVKLLILCIMYGFSLFFGVQLVYYEPRYTDVAVFLIDSFGKPMMYASFGTIMLIMLSIFIKRKV